MADKLIIFDYSGTLSRETVAFSRPASLVRHLQTSGLSALGVDRPELFWEIVNATWLSGSTTRRGYKRVLEERIAELFPEIAVAKRPEICRAAGSFVEAYLEHSRIDELWRTVLQKLAADQSIDTIIATDHYAEATGALIRHISQWDIEAKPLAAAGRSNVMVANSADIGFHKSEQQFWQIVKDALPADYGKILLIDDYGQNEQTFDAYADPGKINERRQKTVHVLQKVFAVNVQDVFFDTREEPWDKLIADTLATVDLFLLG